MKLTKDQQIIETLKQILEDYDYLKYDDTWPDLDELHVQVTDLDAKRNVQVPMKICFKLENATNRKFSVQHGGFYEDSYDFDDGWEGFILYEVNKEEFEHS